MTELFLNKRKDFVYGIDEKSQCPDGDDRVAISPRRVRIRIVNPVHSVFINVREAPPWKRGTP
ncbi:MULTISPECIES: hypothetical protein [Alcanivorax]|uniref:hypothetical protein n=1 Tax=Alcanivorax TaxID=59753 RepID=UPI0013595696|nr:MULTISPECIES: hypothetical protein [Alcanivorax]